MIPFSRRATFAVIAVLSGVVWVYACRWTAYRWRTQGRLSRGRGATVVLSMMVGVILIVFLAGRYTMGKWIPCGIPERALQAVRHEPCRVAHR